MRPLGAGSKLDTLWYYEAKTNQKYGTFSAPKLTETDQLFRLPSGLSSRLIREPLVHFLAAGVMVFLVFDWLPAGDQPGDRQILVGEAGLVALLGFRNPRLGPTAARQYLVEMAVEDRARLVEDYVREEVLYREAIALGLNDNNYAARRRLISQLEYVNQGFIYDSLQLGEADLTAYYQEHRAQYQVSSMLTFTHVYFSADRLGQQGAIDAAATELTALNARAVPFHKAASRGDHFLYHRNYVNKTREEVAAHFGTDFADHIFKLEAAPTWQGPFVSAYGAHLAMVTGHKPAYVPALDEVRAKVADDLARERVSEAMDQFYQQALARYEVTVTALSDPGGP